MRMQMMQQQQQHQQQGMTRPPPPDYKTPMMAAGIATTGAPVPNQPNVMMGQHMGMMAANQQQQGGYPPAIRPGIRPSMVPAQSVAVGRPSPNGATSPMLQNQQQVQQQRPMMNYPQQQQQQQQQPQGMMGKTTGFVSLLMMLSNKNYVGQV